MVRVRTSGPRWVGGVVSLVVFLFGIQLLGTATEAAAVPLGRLFGRYVAGDARALGLSWLATYALTNGSVIAAVSVSLFETGIVTASQLFLMVAGSRLGAAAVVVLIGVIDYLQKRRYSLGKATSLGLLTFLLTHSVYVPATVVGYLLLPWLWTVSGGVGEGLRLPFEPLSTLEPASVAIVDAVGAGPGFVLALLVLVAGLHLFDRVLRGVDATWLRHRVFRRLRNRWVSLALGLLVTGVTTSVAFSLGVVVPLYNRGYVERREIVPYVLGANVGTFLDTIVVAVVLESPEAVTLVVALVAVGAIVTLVAMWRYAAYLRAVEWAQTRLVEDRRYLGAFLASLVAVPLVLSVLPI